MRNSGRNAMKSVKINKEKLQIIVQQNQTKHMEDYIEAVADYKEVVGNICIDNVELAQIGTLSSISDIKPIPSAPKSYKEDYTRAIRMLELSIDDIIELESDVFNQLVLDEWHWKTTFSVLNSTYKTML